MQRRFPGLARNRMSQEKRYEAEMPSSWQMCTEVNVETMAIVWSAVWIHRRQAPSPPRHGIVRNKAKGIMMRDTGFGARRWIICGLAREAAPQLAGELLAELMSADSGSRGISHYYPWTTTYMVSQVPSRAWRFEYR